MTAPRHAFSWLRADSVPRRLCDGVDAATVQAWLAAGRPSIHRRLQDGEPADGVSLGIALPDAAGRARLGFQVDPDAIVETRPAPALGDAVAAAPAAWRGALSGLAMDAARERLDVRVYGSLAWQHLTGETYLRPASDLDVAVWVGDRATLDRALALLAAWDGAARMRLDGELVFPGEAAVAWRELRAGEPEVLVKRPASSGLMPRDGLLAELRAA